MKTWISISGQRRHIGQIGSHLESRVAARTLVDGEQLQALDCRGIGRAKDSEEKMSTSSEGVPSLGPLHLLELLKKVKDTGLKRNTQCVGGQVHTLQPHWQPPGRWIPAMVSSVDLSR